MGIRSWLCRHLCKIKEDSFKPQYLEHIGFTEIYTILQAEYPDTPIYIGDRDYKTIPLAELKKYLRHDDTDRHSYVDEYYDCDDFSFRLMGNLSNSSWGSLPFGIIWVQTETGGAHAVNVFIDNNREIWIVEPADDRVFHTPEGWKPYLIII